MRCSAAMIACASIDIMMFAFCVFEQMARASLGFKAEKNLYITLHENVQCHNNNNESLASSLVLTSENKRPHDTAKEAELRPGILPTKEWLLNRHSQYQALWPLLMVN